MNTETFIQNNEKGNNKLYVIGDIHGCYLSLLNLLCKIHNDIDIHSFNDVDIVFLGDYIDRGPESDRVIDHLISLENSSDKKLRYHFLRGNHEDFALQNNGRNYYNWSYNGGDETLDCYPDGVMDRKHIDWIKETKLTVRIGDIVCVHAAIDPYVSLDNQDEHTILWSRDFDGFEGEYPENVLVVRGHTPVKEIVFKKNQINIDTRAVFGGKLSAIRLDVDEREYEETFQVEGDAVNR